MKILDCFGFCGENEILEIRLETLFEYVDKFVIIEGNKFFNGTGKKKLFDIENFKKYKSKIVDENSIHKRSNIFNHCEEKYSLIFRTPNSSKFK